MATEQQMANLAKAREKRRENIAAKKMESEVMPVEATIKPNAHRISDARPVSATRAVPIPRLPEFAGITNEDCPVECTMERCVVSGKAYCAHPRKCGLAPVDKADMATFERFNRARKRLLHAELDRRP